jgi:hypothetical protein
MRYWMHLSEMYGLRLRTCRSRGATSSAATRSSPAMGAERKPGSDRGRPAIDWEQAFVYYASLPREGRAYQMVADEFGVSRRTVERHGRLEGWAERIGAIEARAAARVDVELGRAWAERIADIDKLVEASFLTYAEQLRTGAVRITASEFVGLARLLLHLHGEPGERIELRVEASAPRPQASPERMLEVVRALQDSGVLAAIEQTIEDEEELGR